MDKCCLNCNSYVAIAKHGQRYPRGHCENHFAYRLSDKFKIYLDIITPDEFICDEYKELSKPVYVMVGDETFLLPPVVIEDLKSKGWVLIRVKADGRWIIEKREGDENANDI